MNTLVLQKIILSSALISLTSRAPSFASASPTQNLPAPAKHLAQAQDPAFEVATIKPSESSAPMMQGLDEKGRYFTTNNTSLRDLIQFAYDVQAKQIVDPSQLIVTDRYDISAVSNQEGVPTLQQVRVMVQKLLSDRYKLTFHNDRRELPAFVLTAGKSEAKLIPTKSEGPVPVNTLEPDSDGWTLFMRNASLSDFISFLQMIVLDRPVVDDTGIAGRFDISVTFTPDDSQFNGHPPPVRRAENGDTAPELFEAVKQQLGLRLEPRRASVDVMVIDRVEKPSPN
jgi:uncharacterized protein (TIGR03435 family)